MSRKENFYWQITQNIAQIDACQFQTIVNELWCVSRTIEIPQQKNAQSQFGVTFCYDIIFHCPNRVLRNAPAIHVWTLGSPNMGSLY